MPENPLHLESKQAIGQAIQLINGNDLPKLLLITAVRYHTLNGGYRGYSEAMPSANEFLELQFWLAAIIEKLYTEVESEAFWKFMMEWQKVAILLDLTNQFEV